VKLTFARAEAAAFTLSIFNNRKAMRKKIKPVRLRPGRFLINLRVFYRNKLCLHFTK
jgi:hypothetical protein